MLPLQVFPNDTGPIYMETLPGRFPTEPYNTISNGIFLILVIYWGVQLYRSPAKHSFLSWVIPTIGICYIGGTMYHGTRSHEFWLLLDWVPITLLCSSAVVYFVFKLTHNWWMRIFSLMLLFGSSYLVRLLPLPPHLSVSLEYVILASTILVPLTWYLIRTKGQYLAWVLLAFGIFGLAIYFRSIDLTQNLLSMGTHWLWHLFGGVAVHLLIAYIFKDNLLNLSANTADHD